MDAIVTREQALFSIQEWWETEVRRYNFPWIFNRNDFWNALLTLRGSFEETGDLICTLPSEEKCLFFLFVIESLDLPSSEDHPK